MTAWQHMQEVNGEEFQVWPINGIMVAIQGRPL